MSRSVNRHWILLVVVALTLVACGQPPPDTATIPDLPSRTTEELIQFIQAEDNPAVVNVWASWCGPCRSEAPLLASAARIHRDDITFVGLNVRDSQVEAKEFIAEFLPDAPIEHIFDRDSRIVADLGGSTGVPLTFFMQADGSVAKIHFGVIDERTIALEIDELVAAAGS